MSQSPGPATPPHVLVVDDDSAIRETLVALLESEGYTVDGAVNGADALARGRERRPDAILLDLAMPVMDGHGFLAARKGDPRLAATPVIVMTASRVAVEGATLFFNKPMDFDALLAAVAHCVAQG